MKNFLYQLYLLATLLLSANVFTACSNADVSDMEPPVAKTYQVIVEANKGDDAAIRALSLGGIDGKTLNATWKEGEEVTVYNSSSVIVGTLTAQSDGSSTTLTGTLTGTINVDDYLRMEFCSPDYDSQEGTLDYIATHCDYATATVSVTSITGNAVTTSQADFANQQAIVKFTLKDLVDNGATPVEATSLTVETGGDTYTVTPTSATNELYVAIPALTDATLSLTANTSTDVYQFSRTGVNFENGKYYAIGVKMTRQVKVADIGKIIATNGCIYDNVAAADDAGTTAAGMIAYVGTPGNNLAIALSDETEDKYQSGAIDAAKDHTPAVTGGTWRLPSMGDWQNMFIACATGGDDTTPEYNMTNKGFRDKLSGIGASTGITTGETYWTSNTCSAVYFSGASACSFQSTYSGEEDFKVRAVLAF